MCGRRTGGRLGAAPRRPGKRPERAAGAPGPRAPLVFRVSLSTKWAADAGARLHLDFLCDGGAGHEGCSEETARHIWVTGGCLAFPSLARRRLHKKYARGRRFAVRWRGNHLRIGTRVLILLCRHGYVPPHRAGAASPKEHGLLKKAAPCKIWGFPPPDFVPTRREDSSLVINTSRSGKTRSIQQNGAWRPQPGGRHASNVSQSSLRTALNTKHIVYRSLSRETLLARSVE